MNAPVLGPLVAQTWASSGQPQSARTAVATRRSPDPDSGTLLRRGWLACISVAGRIAAGASQTGQSRLFTLTFESANCIVRRNGLFGIVGFRKLAPQALAVSRIRIGLCVQTAGRRKVKGVVAAFGWRLITLSGLYVSRVAKAKAVTSQTPSPQSKTLARIVSEDFDLRLKASIDAETGRQFL
ncbi:MAG: hypothetical protein L0Z50_42230, partial [Verrucomicrobiales bacterium]|nr:hypothetical protein [Verrucomicrobiales bacterium]